MSRNRFVRSFAVSLIAVFAVFALPLMHCSTNTTSSTDTGARSASLAAADVTGSCASSTNPYSPVVCISSDGTANPSSLTMHSHNNNSANPLVFRTVSGGGTLTISTTCSQISLGSGCGSGPVCNAQSVPGNTGTCTYSASVSGGAPADPIIVTDNCCPSPGPVAHPGKH